MSRQVKPEVEYGWQSIRTPGSMAYVLPGLVQVLREIGVGKILDLGCGNGAGTAALREQGFDVLGCEPDEEGVALARSRGGRFLQLGVYDDPAELAGETFDAVVSTEVIEHLYLPRKLFAFADKALSEGGYLIVSTPYHGYLKNLALSLTGRWDYHFSSLRDGGHIKFLSRTTLAALFEEHGFEVVGFRGVGRFPFLWKSMIMTGRKA